MTLRAMNQLKMDIQQTIKTLSSGGWSERRIGRELGINRETVARYRRLSRQARELSEMAQKFLPKANDV